MWYCWWEERSTTWRGRKGLYKPLVQSSHVPSFLPHLSKTYLRHAKQTTIPYKPNKHNHSFPFWPLQNNDVSLFLPYILKRTNQTSQMTTSASPPHWKAIVLYWEDVMVHVLTCGGAANSTLLHACTIPCVKMTGFDRIAMFCDTMIMMLWHSTTRLMGGPRLSDWVLGVKGVKRGCGLSIW